MSQGDTTHKKEESKIKLYLLLTAQYITRALRMSWHVTIIVSCHIIAHLKHKLEFIAFLSLLFTTIHFKLPHISIMKYFNDETVLQYNSFKSLTLSIINMTPTSRQSTISLWLLMINAYVIGEDELSKHSY